MDMSLTEAIDRCDLPALIARHCGAASLHGLGPKGGTIKDPRPGKAEQSPSFSLWIGAHGAWMWKKRGRNAGSGTAFTFLTSLGMSGTEARAELLAFTGTRPAWNGGGERPPPPEPDVLTRAREKLADLKPVTHRAFAELQRELLPLRETDVAAHDLQARGLWRAAGLQAFNLHGDLAFLVRGPEGRVYNVKRRRLPPGERGKYSVVFPGLGTPAWCSPGYGQAPHVLLVEGELNAAAVYHAATVQGERLDVQGLAGADTWPFLEGLNREVWIYADPDKSGEAMRARLQDLAFKVGARSVQQVPSLPTGDFCDLLGRDGPRSVWQTLTERPERPARQDQLWPIQHEIQLAARQSPFLGEPGSDAGWPLQRRRRRLD